MAQTLVPHFVNDVGVDRIKIGVKEFQCMGALPPNDLKMRLFPYLMKT